MTDRSTCPDDHGHDVTSTCYVTHGCRCEPCTTGRNEYRYWAAHMRAAGRDDAFPYALVDSTGSQRRLQALIALGWGQRQIAAAAGTDQSRISAVLHRDRIARITAARIATVFEQLSFRIPPTDTLAQRMSVSRVLANARRQKWLPPLAWDDIDTDPDPSDEPDEPQATESEDTDTETDKEKVVDIDDVAVELAITGHRVKLTPAERRQCVRILHAERYSDSLIAETIRCNPKTIERIRAELGLAAYDHTELITRSAA